MSTRVSSANRLQQSTPMRRVSSRWEGSRFSRSYGTRAETMPAMFEGECVNMGVSGVCEGPHSDCQKNKRPKQRTQNHKKNKSPNSNTTHLPLPTSSKSS